MTTTQIIDDIFQVFRERGHKMHGEAVAEMEHALQSATFTGRAGEAPHLIAACLLHDYGHLCHELGEDPAKRGVNALHENVGVNRLSEFDDMGKIVDMATPDVEVFRPGLEPFLRLFP